MVRGAILVMLVGCGFSAGVPGTPGQGQPDAPIGSPGDTPPGDTTPTMTPTVRRIEIGAGKVSGGPHASFPVLVTAAITSAHPSGFDIYFSEDAAGTQRLAHEIERYQPDELVAWVKVPSLSAATTFYLHYGDTAIATSQEDRTAVWSASYAAVWHLSTLADATGTNPGQSAGATTAGGKIASAHAFSNDVIDAGSNGSIDNLFAGGGTIEAWFLATSWGGSGLGRIVDKGPSSTVFSMCDGNQQAALLFGRTFTNGAGNWCTGANTLALNAWTHVAVVYDEGSAGNVPTFYIDGAPAPIGLTSSPSGSASSEASAALTIGDRSSGGRAFAGRLDEVRLSTTTRSAAWIATSYDNQRDPAAFCVVSPPL